MSNGFWRNIASALVLVLFAALAAGSGDTDSTTSTNTVEEAPKAEVNQRGGVEYPTHPGDKGRYFIEEITKNSNYYTVITRREGPSGVNWTKVVIDFNNPRMKTIALAYDNFETMKALPKSEQGWYELVNGSSKSYLYDFVRLNYVQKSN